MAGEIRRRRHGFQSNWQWHMDEVFVKIHGELPNKDLDLLIKLVIQNGGRVTKKRRKKFYGWISEQELKSLEVLIGKTLAEVRDNTDEVN